MPLRLPPLSGNLGGAEDARPKVFRIRVSVSVRIEEKVRHPMSGLCFCSRGEFLSRCVRDSVRCGSDSPLRLRVLIDSCSKEFIHHLIKYGYDRDYTVFSVFVFLVSILYRPSEEAFHSFA